MKFFSNGAKNATWYFLKIEKDERKSIKQG
jgi:hypothetical protein